MDIKILVATHKAYWMPEDDVYLPLHVGREGKQDLGFVGDNRSEERRGGKEWGCRGWAGG